VDVEDAIGEGFDEKRGEKAHVSGEAHEVDFVFVENCDYLTVEGFALEALGWETAGREAAGLRAIDAGSAFAIADNDGDFGVGDAAGRDAIGESFEIGAATGQEHG
jgi:hypothetical protein